MTAALALIAAAIGIGSIHTLAPDHWMPFAALARAERWSARRAAAVTAGCGLGHVTTSVALGLLAVGFGREVFEVFGRRLESVAGLLLVGFGVAYGIWGLHRRMSERAHAHAHAHGYHHAHTHSHGQDEVHRPVTAWSLFLVFSADPCVAVIPLTFAASPFGWTTTLAVVAAYELATIVTMVALVLPARAAIRTVRAGWADEWGDALAGAVVAGAGIVVMGLGI
jgi:nickel/cobalt transporter (NicO) family protein